MLPRLYEAADIQHGDGAAEPLQSDGAELLQLQALLWLIALTKVPALSGGDVAVARAGVTIQLQAVLRKRGSS